MSLFVVVLVDKFIKLLRKSLRATRLRNINRSRIEHRKRMLAGDAGDPEFRERYSGFSARKHVRPHLGYTNYNDGATDYTQIQHPGIDASSRYYMRNPFG